MSLAGCMTARVNRRPAVAASLALHAALAGAAVLPFLDAAPPRPASPDGIAMVWVTSAPVADAEPDMAAADTPDLALPDAPVPDAAPAELPLAAPAEPLVAAPVPLPLPEWVSAMSPTDPAPESVPSEAAPATPQSIMPAAPAPQPATRHPTAPPQPNSTPRRLPTPQRPGHAGIRPAAAEAQSRVGGPAAAATTVAAAMPPTAQAAVAPGPILVTAPRYRSPPAPPVYPPRAVEFGLTGTVMVRARVAPDGRTEEVRLWRGSGHALLDAAALAAVRRWAFEAAAVDGRRVEAWVEVPVHFRLN